MCVTKLRSVSLLTVFINNLVLATIDLNLPELEYLADHLHPEECRKLTAALHFQSYQEPNALDQAERKIPKEIPCLKLLLHWNSAEGEGKGETHEAVEHRLRQMGRYDLADWLGKTVFHQLGKDLERSMDNPFEGLSNTTERKHNYVKLPTLQPPVKVEDPGEWLPFDTVCYAISGFLTFCIVLALLRILCLSLCVRKRQRPRRKRLRKKQYDELENPDSGSESEDRFDVRDYKQRSPT